MNVLDQCNNALVPFFDYKPTSTKDHSNARELFML